MAAKVTTTKITLGLKLENGTTASGNPILLSQTLGAINKDTFDADKALAIGLLCAPVLSKTLYSIEQTTKANIASGE